MPKRLVSIWFPHLLTDWLAVRKPALQQQVLVFTAPVHGKLMITATNGLAEAQGIFKGMALADAKAIVTDIQVFDDQLFLAEKLLIKLGKWCIRFTPIVGIDLPDGLILDSSGCSHLWGGEEKYLKTMLKRLRESGFNGRCSVADTIGAAWANARYGIPIVSPHQQYESLLRLPSMALRLDLAVIQRLNKLGLNRISSFIQMPRSILRRRFGEELLLKIGQALGTEAEVIQPLLITPPYEQRLPCLEPIRTKTAIEIAITNLLNGLCTRLKNERMGIRQAVLKGYRIDGKITQIQVGTNQSTHHVRHLFKLFELKIAQIEPALGIELFVLTATKIEVATTFQEKLWTGNAGLSNQNLAQLLDRLAGKVGVHTIHRYLPHAHFWPERTIRPAASLEEQTEDTWKLDNPRPMELLRDPEPVQVTAPIPDYPPMNFRYKEELHHIKKADGPERIEREWWIDEGEHRDYYIVEDEKGQRYWLFRSGHYAEENSKWFIHGFFA